MSWGLSPTNRLGHRISFFFFQAEDGIRDHCVTGVQTCALPICLNVLLTAYVLWLVVRSILPRKTITQYFLLVASLSLLRSEERRVGKECRSRWSRDD